MKFEDIANLIREVVPHKNADCALDLNYAGKELLNHSDTQPIQLSEEDLISCSLIGKEDEDGNFYLYTRSGNLASTTHMRGKHSDGVAAFALDKLGKLYIHEHRTVMSHPEAREYFYHSSFFSGRPGKCFGMMKIENGKITYISNHSGHYKPKSEHLRDAVLRLTPYFSAHCVVNDLFMEDEEFLMIRAMFGGV